MRGLIGVSDPIAHDLAAVEVQDQRKIKVAPCDSGW
jgi:hypothetical protein